MQTERQKDINLIIEALKKINSEEFMTVLKNTSSKDLEELQDMIIYILNMRMG